MSETHPLRAATTPRPSRAAEPGRALRVSRYLGEERHVRFSVWDERGRALAAVSLDDEEADRLRGFLATPRVRKRSLLEQLLSR